jgi:hypothetical protein
VVDAPGIWEQVQTPAALVSLVAAFGLFPRELSPLGAPLNAKLWALAANNTKNLENGLQDSGSGLLSGNS